VEVAQRGRENHEKTCSQLLLTQSGRLGEIRKYLTDKKKMYPGDSKKVVPPAYNESVPDECEEGEDRNKR